MKTKMGFCPIERRMTIFMQLPNKKWMCSSSGCGGIRGQHKELPKPPKIIQPLDNPEKFKYI